MKLEQAIGLEDTSVFTKLLTARRDAGREPDEQECYALVKKCVFEAPSFLPHLIEAKISIQSLGKYQQSVLEVACLEKNYPAAELCVRYGAVVRRERGARPYELAPPHLRWLLVNAAAQPSDTPDAKPDQTKPDHLAVMRACLDADPSAADHVAQWRSGTPLMGSPGAGEDSSSEDSDVEEDEIKTGYIEETSTALFAAAWVGNFKAVTLLLQYKEVVVTRRALHRGRGTAVHAAALRGHLEILSALLLYITKRRGDGAAIIESLSNPLPMSDATALSMALRHAKKSPEKASQVIKELIKAGVRMKRRPVLANDPGSDSSPQYDVLASAYDLHLTHRRNHASEPDEAGAKHYGDIIDALVRQEKDKVPDALTSWGEIDYFASVWRLVFVTKDLDLYERLALAGMPLNIYNHEGFNFIFTLADADNQAGVKKLLEHAPRNASDNPVARWEVDPDGNTILHIALAKGWTDVAQILLRHDPSMESARGKPEKTTAFAKARAVVQAHLPHDDQLARTMAEVKRNYAGDTFVHCCLASPDSLEFLERLIDLVPSLLNDKSAVGQTPIMYAAERGNEAAILRLLALGETAAAGRQLDLQAYDQYGNTLVHYASSQRRKIGTVETAHPYENDEDRTWPAFKGYSRYYVEFDVRTATENNYDVLVVNGRRLTGELAPWQPLVVDEPMLQFRFTSDGSVTRWGILASVLADRPFEKTTIDRVIRVALDAINIENNNGETPLHVAVTQDNAVAVETLLGAGVKVDAGTHFETPLFRAFILGNHLIAKAILRHSDRPNISVRDASGKSMLHVAVHKQDVRLTSMIVGAAGVSDRALLNAVDMTGMTALMMCVDVANISTPDNSATMPPAAREIMTILLSEHVHVDIQNAQRETALHIAIRRGHAQAACWLLDAGANPSLTNLNGENVLMTGRVPSYISRAILKTQPAAGMVVSPDGWTAAYRAGTPDPLIDLTLLRRLHDVGCPLDKTPLNQPSLLEIASHFASNDDPDLAESARRMSQLLTEGAKRLEEVLPSLAQLNKEDDDRFGQEALPMRTAPSGPHRAFELALREDDEKAALQVLLQNPHLAMATGETAVHHLVVTGKHKVLSDYVDQQRDVVATIVDKKHEMQTPLIVACKQLQLETVRVLLKAGAAVTDVAWQAALDAKALPILQEFALLKSDPNHVHHKRVAELSVEALQSGTAMSDPALVTYVGDDTLRSLLLRCKVNADVACATSKDTALIRVFSLSIPNAQRVSIITELLDAGAKPNSVNARGETALSICMTQTTLGKNNDGSPWLYVSNLIDGCCTIDVEASRGSVQLDRLNNGLVETVAVSTIPEVIPHPRILVRWVEGENHFAVKNASPENAYLVQELSGLLRGKGASPFVNIARPGLIPSSIAPALRSIQNRDVASFTVFIEDASVVDRKDTLIETIKDNWEEGFQIVSQNMDMQDIATFLREPYDGKFPLQEAVVSDKALGILKKLCTQVPSLQQLPFDSGDLLVHASVFAPKIVAYLVGPYYVQVDARNNAGATPLIAMFAKTVNTPARVPWELAQQTAQILLSGKTSNKLIAMVDNANLSALNYAIRNLRGSQLVELERGQSKEIYFAGAERLEFIAAPGPKGGLSKLRFYENTEQTRHLFSPAPEDTMVSHSFQLDGDRTSENSALTYTSSQKIVAHFPLETGSDVARAHFFVVSHYSRSGSAFSTIDKLVSYFKGGVDESVLSDAITYAPVDFIQYLLEKTTRPSDKTLETCIEQTGRRVEEREEIARLLLDHGALEEDADAGAKREKLLRACYQAEMMDLAGVLLDKGVRPTVTDSDGNMATVYAVRHASLTLLEKSLQACMKDPALSLTTTHYFDIIAALLESPKLWLNGIIALFMEEPSLMNAKDSAGKTFVEQLWNHRSPAEEKLPILQALIEKGYMSIETPLNANDVTLLHVGHISAEFMMFALSRATQTQLNATTKAGETPLMAFLDQTRPNPTVCERMLHAGARVDGVLAENEPFMAHALDKLFGARAAAVGQSTARVSQAAEQGTLRSQIWMMLVKADLKHFATELGKPDGLLPKLKCLPYDVLVETLSNVSTAQTHKDAEALLAVEAMSAGRRLRLRALLHTLSVEETFQGLTDLSQQQPNEFKENLLPVLNSDLRLVQALAKEGNPYSAPLFTMMETLNTEDLINVMNALPLTIDYNARFRSAVRAGKHKLVRALIESTRVSHDEVVAADKESSVLIPLLWAPRATCELLLSCGVDVNSTDEQGNTPLVALLNSFHLDRSDTVAAWLFSHNADRFKANRRGEYFASIQSHYSFVENLGARQKVFRASRVGILCTTNEPVECECEYLGTCLTPSRITLTNSNKTFFDHPRVLLTFPSPASRDGCSFTMGDYYEDSSDGESDGDESPIEMPDELPVTASPLLHFACVLQHERTHDVLRSTLPIATNCFQRQEFVPLSSLLAQFTGTYDEADLQAALYYGVKTRWAVCIVPLCERGASPFKPHAPGEETPFVLAVRLGFKEAVEALLPAGSSNTSPDVTAYIQTEAALLAVHNADMLEQLVTKYGAEVNAHEGRALMDAVTGDVNWPDLPAVLKLLLHSKDHPDKCCDPVKLDAVDMTALARLLKHAPSAEHIPHYEAAVTELVAAMETIDKTCITKFASATKETYLHLAVTSAPLSVVKSIAAKSSKKLEAVDNNGHTPLGQVLISARPDQEKQTIVTALLELGAEESPELVKTAFMQSWLSIAISLKNIKGISWTAEEWNLAVTNVCMARDGALIRKLLEQYKERKAEFDAWRSPEGDTILHVFASSVEVMKAIEKVLDKSGVLQTVNVRNSEGQTPLAHLLLERADASEAAISELIRQGAKLEDVTDRPLEAFLVRQVSDQTITKGLRFDSASTVRLEFLREGVFEIYVAPESTIRNGELRIRKESKDVFRQDDSLRVVKEDLHLDPLTWTTNWVELTVGKPSPGADAISCSLFVTVKFSFLSGGDSEEAIVKRLLNDTVEAVTSAHLCTALAHGKFRAAKALIEGKHVDLFTPAPETNALPLDIVPRTLNSDADAFLKLLQITLKKLKKGHAEKEKLTAYVDNLLQRIAELCIASSDATRFTKLFTDKLEAEQHAGLLQKIAATGSQEFILELINGGVVNAKELVLYASDLVRRKFSTVLVRVPPKDADACLALDDPLFQLFLIRYVILPNKLSLTLATAADHGQNAKEASWNFLVSMTASKDSQTEFVNASIALSMWASLAEFGLGALNEESMKLIADKASISLPMCTYFLRQEGTVEKNPSSTLKGVSGIDSIAGTSQEVFWLSAVPPQERMTSLLLAIEACDLRGVHSLLSLGGLTLDSSIVAAACKSAHPFGMLKFLLQNQIVAGASELFNDGEIWERALSSAQVARVVDFLIQRNVALDLQHPKTKNTCLHEACLKKSARVVQLLVQRMLSLDTVNKENESALHLAASAGFAVGIRLLLWGVRDKFADHSLVDNKGQTAFFDACSKPTCGINITMITNSTNFSHRRHDGDTALHVALASVDPDLPKLALTRGENVEAMMDVLNAKKRAPIHTVCAFSSAAMLRLLSLHTRRSKISGFNLKDEGGNTILHHAARQGDESAPMVVYQLLINGASSTLANNQLEAPIMLAVTHSSPSVLFVFLYANVNVNTHDIRGDTPLHLCTSFSSPPLVHERLLILLAHGANVNAQNNAKETVLLRVAGRSEDSMAALLMRHADPNLPDETATTPLHKVATESYQAVKLLLDKHAPVDPMNHDRMTPLALAIKRFCAPDIGDDAQLTQRRIITLLLERGASASFGEGLKMTLPRMVIRSPNGPDKELLELLLKKGANPSALSGDENYGGASADGTQRETAMHAACALGDLPSIDVLLKNGADWAMLNGDNKSATDLLIERTKLTLSHDVIPTPIRLPINHTVDIPCDSGDRVDVLFKWTKSPGERCDIIIRTRTDVTAAEAFPSDDGYTYRMEDVSDTTIQACLQCDDSAVVSATATVIPIWKDSLSALLTLLTKLNFADDPKLATVPSPFVELSIAIVKNDVEAVRRLVVLDSVADFLPREGRATISPRPHGCQLSALHMATAWHKDVEGKATPLSILLLAGADVGKLDQYKGTPLITACRKNNEAAAMTLLEFIARNPAKWETVKVIDVNELSALSYAVSNGLDKVIKFMMNYKMFTVTQLIKCASTTGIKLPERCATIADIIREEIRKSVVADRESFEDNEFLRDAKSLGHGVATGAHTLVWARPAQIDGADVQHTLFVEGASMSDVAAPSSSKLGFLSGLALLASSGSFEAIFCSPYERVELPALPSADGAKGKQPKAAGAVQEIPVGASIVRVSNGNIWQLIVVDDYLPCDLVEPPVPSVLDEDTTEDADADASKPTKKKGRKKKGKDEVESAPVGPRLEPRVTRCRDARELWLPLLEKALAKCQGTFDSVARLTAKETIELLTKSEIQSFSLLEGGTHGGQNAASLETIEFALHAERLVTCSRISSKKAEELQCSSRGIYERLPYSIVDILRVPGEGILLQLFNPFDQLIEASKRKRWSGPWSSQSLQWTTEMRRLVSTVHEADKGYFYMSWNDFIAEFNLIDIFRFPRISVEERIQKAQLRRTFVDWSGTSKGDAEVPRDAIALTACGPTFIVVSVELTEGSPNTSMSMILCREKTRGEESRGYSIDITEAQILKRVQPTTKSSLTLNYRFFPDHAQQPCYVIPIIDDPAAKATIVISTDHVNVAVLPKQTTNELNESADRVEENQRDPGLIEADKVTYYESGKQLYRYEINPVDVLGWGKGESLGMNSHAAFKTPTVNWAFARSRIVQASCGDNHAGAVSKEGTLYTWGNGSKSRLGHNNDRNYFIPTRVEALVGIRVTAVACGSSHTLALSDDGGVYAFGMGDNGRLGLGSEESALVPTRIRTLASKNSTVVALACGLNHSACLTSAGDIYTWGSQESGKLGHGVSAGHQLDPMKIDTISNAVAIQCGHQHTVALTRAGVYTWGSNANGRLGLGDAYKNVPFEARPYLIVIDKRTAHQRAADEVKGTEEPSPKIVSGSVSDQARTKKERRLQKDDVVVAISAIRHHTALLTQRGEVFTWGMGDDYRLGHNDTHERNVATMVEVLDNTVVVKISCGWAHTAVMTEEGTIQVWGVSTFGLSDKAIRPIRQPVTLGIDAPEGINEIISGRSFSMAISSTGSLFVYGRGRVGELGQGPDVKERQQPTRMQNLEGLQMVALSAGKSHAATRTADGRLYVFGSGEAGKLGLGNDADATVPTRVPAFMERKVVNMSMGETHSGAVTDGGDLFMWGNGKNYRLGNNSDKSSSVPSLVPVGMQVSVVSCGGTFTLALITGWMRVYAWGDNTSGQCGLDSTEQDIATPTPIRSFMFKPSLEARLAKEKSEKPTVTRHELATIAVNHEGSKADCHPVEAISAGHDHALLLTDDGRVFAWGSGHFGCLGNAAMQNAKLPTEVVTILRDPTENNTRHWHEISRIKAGRCASFVTTREGRTFSWGCNEGSKLGLGVQAAEVLVPMEVQIPRCTNVDAGDYHTAWTTQSGLYTAGLSRHGEGGHGEWNANVLLQEHLPIVTRDLASLKAGAKDETADEKDDEAKNKKGGKSEANLAPQASKLGGGKSMAMVALSAGPSKANLASASTAQAPLTSRRAVAAAGANVAAEKKITLVDWTNTTLNPRFAVDTRLLPKHVRSIIDRAVFDVACGDGFTLALSNSLHLHEDPSASHVYAESVTDLSASRTLSRTMSFMESTMTATRRSERREVFVHPVIALFNVTAKDVTKPFASQDEGKKDEKRIVSTRVYEGYRDGLCSALVSVKDMATMKSQIAPGLQHYKIRPCLFCDRVKSIKWYPWRTCKLLFDSSVLYASDENRFGAPMLICHECAVEKARKHGFLELADCEKAGREAVDRCRKVFVDQGVKYVDREHPPMEGSLWKHGLRPPDAELICHPTEWRRISDMGGHRIPVYVDDDPQHLEDIEKRAESVRSDIVMQQMKTTPSMEATLILSSKKDQRPKLFFNTRQEWSPKECEQFELDKGAAKEAARKAGTLITTDDSTGEESGFKFDLRRLDVLGVFAKPWDYRPDALVPRPIPYTRISTPFVPPEYLKQYLPWWRKFFSVAEGASTGEMHQIKPLPTQRSPMLQLVSHKGKPVTGDYEKHKQTKDEREKFGIQPSLFIDVKGMIEDPRVFIGEASPGDVEQGAIGTCYLLGSLSVMATKPGLVERMFIDYDYEAGVYAVRFFYKDRWFFVLIDDYIPCTDTPEFVEIPEDISEKPPTKEETTKEKGKEAAKETAKEKATGIKERRPPPITRYDEGKPLYGWCKLRNELYVMLIEKAYGMLKGSYEAIDGGIDRYAMVECTGGVCEQLNFSDPKVSRTLTTGAFWEMMLGELMKGKLMSCYKDDPNAATEEKLPNGLIVGHAYAITGTTLVGLNRLLKIRNPHGRSEWNGNWATLKKQVMGEAVEDDGEFHMNYDDFIHNFSAVDVTTLLQDTVVQREKEEDQALKLMPGPSSLTAVRLQAQPTYLLNVEKDRTRVAIQLEQIRLSDAPDEAVDGEEICLLVVMYRKDWDYIPASGDDQGIIFGDLRNATVVDRVYPTPAMKVALEVFLYPQDGYGFCFIPSTTSSRDVYASIKVLANSKIIIEELVRVTPYLEGDYLLDSDYDDYSYSDDYDDDEEDEDGEEVVKALNQTKPALVGTTKNAGESSGAKKEVAFDATAMDKGKGAAILSDEDNEEEIKGDDEPVDVNNLPADLFVTQKIESEEVGPDGKKVRLVREITVPRHGRALAIMRRGREKVQTQRRGREKVQAQRRGREKNQAQSRGREKSQTQRRGREKSQVQRRGREKSQVQRRGRDKQTQRRGRDAQQNTVLRRAREKAVQRRGRDQARLRRGRKAAVGREGEFDAQRPVPVTRVLHAQRAAATASDNEPVLSKLTSVADHLVNLQEELRQMREPAPVMANVVTEVLSRQSSMVGAVPKRASQTSVISPNADEMAQFRAALAVMNRFAGGAGGMPMAAVPALESSRTDDPSMVRQLQRQLNELQSELMRARADHAQARAESTEQIRNLTQALSRLSEDLTGRHIGVPSSPRPLPGVASGATSSGARREGYGRPPRSPSPLEHTADYPKATAAPAWPTPAPSPSAEGSSGAPIAVSSTAEQAASNPTRPVLRAGLGRAGRSRSLSPKDLDYAGGRPPLAPVGGANALTSGDIGSPTSTTPPSLASPPIPTDRRTPSPRHQTGEDGTSVGVGPRRTSPTASGLPPPTSIAARVPIPRDLTGPTAKRRPWNRTTMLPELPTALDPARDPETNNDF